MNYITLFMGMGYVAIKATNEGVFEIYTFNNKEYNFKAGDNIPSEDIIIKNKGKRYIHIYSYKELKEFSDIIDKVSYNNPIVKYQNIILNFQSPNREQSLITIKNGINKAMSYYHRLMAV